ncbi:MAG: NAD-dependent epimerase/dehydratase family protein [Isosphaeraceae bacterium]
MKTESRKQGIHVGLVGAGYIADWHARSLVTIPGVRLVGVCDTDTARARSLADRYGGAGVYGDLEEMLDDQALGLDAVHVLLPPQLHEQAARAIVDRGLHAFLEKPMAVTVEACDELIDRAEQRGVKLAVNHNYLYAPVYERLREDVAAGKLGRLDGVTITWNRELEQLQSGPFDLWMLRHPRNIILEIGPHCLGPVVDLLGAVDVVAARPSNRVTLPLGQDFYRHWSVVAEAGAATALLNLSFAPGFTEQVVHVRGSLASATADLERDTYVLHQHTPHGLDFDRYAMIRREARSLAVQARHGLTRYILGKLKLSSGGSPYGTSIDRSIRAFYGANSTKIDDRISAQSGRKIIDLCFRIADEGLDGAESPEPQGMLGAHEAAAKGPRTTGPPEILVLGATGFIGRELARQLVEGGRPIRLLVRNPSKLPRELFRDDVEIVRGDLTRGEDLEKATRGCRFLYHLARPQANTWEEFQRQDVEVTRKVAEAALALGVERFIYTSTIDSYYAGSRAGTITEATPLDPHIKWRNAYARSKAASEEILWDLRRDRRLPLVVFRPGIVLGRGGSPFHWGIGMWSWNAVCQVWGRGDHPLPFVLVEDVAGALVTALDAPGIEGEAFNLVADTRISALEYLEILESHAGVSFQKLPTPPWRFYVGDLGKWVIKRLVRHPDRRRPSYRDWETRTQRAYYDCTKARSVLGWNPITDREEFIRRAIEIPWAEHLGSVEGPTRKDKDKDRTALV